MGSLVLGTWIFTIKTPSLWIFPLKKMKCTSPFLLILVWSLFCQVQFFFLIQFLIAVEGWFLFLDPYISQWLFIDKVSSLILWDSTIAINCYWAMIVNSCYFLLLLFFMLVMVVLMVVVVVYVCECMCFSLMWDYLLPMFLWV